MRRIALLACLVPSLAGANTYSLDGAGATVVPLQRTSVKVVREELSIEPSGSCYQVLFDGKPHLSRRRSRAEAIRILEQKILGQPGRRVSCPPRVRGGVMQARAGSVFHPPWRARVRYTLEASQPVERVQMGFPLQLGFLEYLKLIEEPGAKPAPGVLDYFLLDGRLHLISTSAFEVRVDGKPVAARLAPFEQPEADERAPRWVYAWEHSFKQGTTQIEISYEFDGGGLDAGEGAYPSRADDLSTWPFVFPAALSKADRARLDKDAYAFVERWFGFDAFELLYWMVPIKTWGGPPSEIVATIRVPPALTPLHLEARGWIPDCVDGRALYFRLRDRFPEKDLSFYYPNASKHVVPMTRAGEWQAWRKHHPTTRLACELLTNLRRQPGLKDELRAVECVATCR